MHFFTHFCLEYVDTDLPAIIRSEQDSEQWIVQMTIADPNMVTIDSLLN